jgi:hypothetical protein
MAGSSSITRPTGSLMGMGWRWCVACGWLLLWCCIFLALGLRGLRRGIRIRCCGFCDDGRNSRKVEGDDAGAEAPSLYKFAYGTTKVVPLCTSTSRQSFPQPVKSRPFAQKRPTPRMRSGPVVFGVSLLSYALAVVRAPRSAASFSVLKASMMSPSLMSLKLPRPMPHSMPLVTSRTSSLTRLRELILPL